MKTPSHLRASPVIRQNKRSLSREEHQLWEHVARDIRPLAHPKTPKTIITNYEMPLPSFSQAREDAEKILSDQNIQEFPKKINSKNQNMSLPTTSEKKLPPLSSLETKVLKALKKGRKDVEAKLDLHGMYQQEAFSALRSFLFKAHSQAKTVVLVVTGKGSTYSFASHFEHSDGKGILRRMLPQWLASPELRSIVLGYEEASLRHGGSGAFYVRLRKKL